MNSRALIQCMILMALTMQASAAGATVCGSQSFATQAEVDAFATMGCDTIVGDLAISSALVTELDSLYPLRYVTGQISIEETLIEDFAGLNSLQGVVGSFTVRLNQSLVNFAGLDSLTTVGGTFFTEFNSMTSFTGLESLAAVGALNVWDNFNLVNFTGLSGLSQVSSMDCINNFSLHDFTGLSGLDSIPGNLIVQGNTVMEDLSGLSNLHVINGNFILETNPALTGIQLPMLKRVGGHFKALDLDALESFPGLDSLRTIDQVFEVRGNLGLLSFEGLSNLEYTSRMVVENNTNLINFTGLQSLTEVFYSPTSEGIEVSANASLVSFTGLESLDHVGRLYIADNPMLQSLDGLQFLRLVEEHITLNENDILRGLDSLNHLEVIGGNMVVYFNDSLTTIAGLDKLKVIGGDLDVTWNSSLVLVAIPSLDFLGGDLIFSGNASLSDCCIIPAWQKDDVIAGATILDGNAEGCTSVAEVLVSCYSADKDLDGVAGAIDNCPERFNPVQQDSDGDGVGNACDNCPLTANPDQADSNSNFIGDACETAEPGKVGVNSTAPQAGFQIDSSDIFINDSHRGIILKDVQGICYRLTIGDSGQLQTVEIDCP